MAAEDLESIEATLELLADPAAQQRIAQSQQEGLPEAVACACYEFIRGPLAEERRRVGAPGRQEA